MKKALAIDVGGTKIYNTIVDELGNIVAEIEKRATPKTFEEIRAVLQEIVQKYEGEVDVIAFATAGAVNNENTGVLGSTGNIAPGYPNMDFVNLSKKKVFVENDANAAAWAEHVLGASKGCAHSVMLTLGTGVGAVLYKNKEIYYGEKFDLGKFAHYVLVENGILCDCGQKGCAEKELSKNFFLVKSKEYFNEEKSAKEVFDLFNFSNSISNDCPKHIPL